MIAVFIALTGIIIVGFVLPLGSYVYVVANVTDENVTINKCALEQGHLLDLLNPDANVSQGDRTVILKVFYNQTELLSSERCIKNNVGTGNCVLESQSLPNDLPIDAVLTIQVELYDSNDTLIANAEDNLIYS